jgi:hypothetical protein
MEETAEFLRRMAALHRKMARSLRDPETAADLMRLAEECDERAAQMEPQQRGAAS